MKKTTKMTIKKVHKINCVSIEFAPNWIGETLVFTNIKNHVKSADQNEIFPRLQFSKIFIKSRLFFVFLEIYSHIFAQIIFRQM